MTQIHITFVFLHYALILNDQKRKKKTSENQFYL